MTSSVNGTNNGTSEEDSDDVRWSSEGRQEECSVRCQASSASLCTNTATVLDLNATFTFWSYILVRVLNTLTLGMVLVVVYSVNGFIVFVMLI